MSATETKARAKDLAAIAGCTTLAFVLYLNTLNAGFVYDDRRAILGNADVTGAAASLPQLLHNDYWGTPLMDSGSHGSWRPLCVLSFRLNFQLSQGTPFAFHLANLLLHCLATALVMLVARTLLATRAALLATGALFAAHPVHTEAVAGVVGRADLGSCVCCLLAYLAYAQHMQHRDWQTLALTLLLALAALLCKETGIVTLLLCGLSDLLRSEHSKQRLRSLSVLLAAMLSTLYGRLMLLPRPTVSFSTADNPAAHESCWWTRTLTFLYLPVVNLQLLLWPQLLSFDWGMDAIPPIRTLWDARNLLSVALYGSLLTLGCKAMRLHARSSCPSLGYADMASISLPLLRRLGGNSCQAWHELLCACQLSQLPPSRKLKTPTMQCPVPESAAEATLYVALSFLVLPFLPASNLFLHVGFVLAERVLYLPSVGYCLLFGLGFGKLWQRFRAISSKRLLLCCLTFLLCALSLRTVQRNRDWHTEEQLFGSAIAVNPPKALANLGSILSAQGRYEEAKLALEAAIGQRANMADAHFNLGIVHQQQQNFNAAIPYYRRAIQLRPQLAVAHLNLATSLLASNQSRDEEAASVLLTAARLPGHGVRDRKAHEEARCSAYLQLSALQRARGMPQQAVELLHESLTALHSPQQRATLHQRLAALHMQLEQWTEAEQQQHLALQLQPQQGAVYVSYGQTLARNCSRHAEAELWFKRALELSPHDPSAHHHYADFLEQQQRPEQALKYRLRAASLAPTNYALQAAVADALRALNRLAEAELWYRHAAALHPQAAHAHANLGAILQMRGRRQQAVECYRKALQLQPGHATSRANLAQLNVNIDVVT
ncbi:CG31690 [Drosophila busckii]|uniref:dolichyl-phosphate-mannose--protein mannosyltransferase n=2 Tax=Drosophila busckii TaxID=30019 RepID=A0A0M4EGN7_DROBS|nr:CG31690 [Drosophila busckii]